MKLSKEEINLLEQINKFFKQLYFHIKKL